MRHAADAFWKLLFDTQCPTTVNHGVAFSFCLPCTLSAKSATAFIACKVFRTRRPQRPFSNIRIYICESKKIATAQILKQELRHKNGKPNRRNKCFPASQSARFEVEVTFPADPDFTSIPPEACPACRHYFATAKNIVLLASIEQFRRSTAPGSSLNFSSTPGLLTQTTLSIPIHLLSPVSVAIRHDGVQRS